jgi:hypothetical protein
MWLQDGSVPPYCNHDFSKLLRQTDVSEELSASIIRVTRIGENGTTLTVTIYG